MLDHPSTSEFHVLVLTLKSHSYLINQQLKIVPNVPLSLDCFLSNYLFSNENYHPIKVQFSINFSSICLIFYPFLFRDILS